MPAVRAVALRAVCRRAGKASDGAGRRRARRSEPRGPARRAGGPARASATSAARARVAALAASPAPSDRAGAARVAGEAATRRSAALLSALLADPSPVVRRAAVAAAGRARERTLWPPVADALGDRRLRGAAVAALRLGGTGRGRGRSRRAFDGAAASPVARAAARVLGRLAGRSAQDALRAHLGLPRPDRAPGGARVAAALRVRARRRERGGGRGPPPARGGARRRGLDAGRPARPAAGAGVRRPERGPRRELGRSRQAILLLLSSCTTRWPSCARATASPHGSREKRAYALEVLDVTLAADFKPRVLALLEDRRSTGASAPLARPIPPGPARRRAA